MSDAARTPAHPKLLLVNHFDLETVCGTTVMFGELLRVAPRSAPDIEFAYQSYEPHASAAELRARLDAAHTDASCVVAVNAHIEVMWNLSEELFAWCRARGTPAYVYAHDYWPHHKEYLSALTTRHGARVIVSTPFIAEALRQEGFSSEVIDVGVPLPDVWPAVATPASPKRIASAGRLVPRKRLPDIVRGFAGSGLDGVARLYLRALPSNVFSPDSDAEQLREIHAAIEQARLTSVVVDRQPGEQPDYRSYSAYVCSSSYEGFSMAVIESAFHGCPPLMSDILPHQRIARALFGAQAADFMYPVGDCHALAGLMRDEITTARRKALLDARIDEIRATIAARFSLAGTARALARLARDVSGPPAPRVESR